MSVRSAQSITKVFTTRRFDTGAATNGDSTPTGTLYVNGTADAATVTVTNITTGVYKAAVTLPTLAVGDIVDLRISATVNSVTDNAIVWQDTKDLALDSSYRPGIDWANVGTPGSTVNLSATTVNLVNTTTTVTNQLTAAQVATGVWQDSTAGDFTVASSIGKSLYTSGVVPGGSGGLLISGSNSGTTTLAALTVSGATTLTGAVTATNASNDVRGVALAANQHVIVDSGTVTTVTNQLTTAQIATAVWTDTTAGDFTTALSIGKSIMNGVSLGTGLTVARCTLTDTLTTYTGDTPQSGDAFARIGATGSGLTSLAPASTALSTAQWTNALATKLGGLTFTVATVLDVNIQYVNDVQVNGVGSVANPWGP